MPCSCSSTHRRLHICKRLNLARATQAKANAFLHVDVCFSMIRPSHSNAQLESLRAEASINKPSSGSHRSNSLSLEPSAHSQGGLQLEQGRSLPVEYEKVCLTECSSSSSLAASLHILSNSPVSDVCYRCWSVCGPVCRIQEAFA